MEKCNETREQWLRKHNREEHDVIVDLETGDEYIMVEYENGNPGEDGYDVTMRTQLLPDEIQTINRK